MTFTFLDHDADIKIRITSPSEGGIYEEIIKALATYSADMPIKAVKGKTITVKGDDRKALLYAFIEELLFLIDTQQFIASKGTVTIRGNNLQAELYGDNTKNYALEAIKAPTFAEMQFEKTKQGWEAIIVIDV
ncbi:archease [Candidatus Pacearchaeota archaeon]|nr:archease [Candidatus Pacearchaeota archaeon]